MPPGWSWRTKNPLDRFVLLLSVFPRQDVLVLDPSPFVSLTPLLLNCSYLWPTALLPCNLLLFFTPPLIPVYRKKFGPPRPKSGILSGHTVTPRADVFRRRAVVFDSATSAAAASSSFPPAPPLSAHFSSLSSSFTYQSEPTSPSSWHDRRGSAGTRTARCG